MAGAAHLSRFRFPFTAGRRIRDPATIQFQTFTTIVWFRSFVQSFQTHITITSTTTNHMNSGGIRQTKPVISEFTENCTCLRHSLKLKKNSWLHPVKQTVTCLVVLRRSCSGRTPHSSPHSGVQSFGHFISILAISPSTCVASQAQNCVLMSRIFNQ